MSSTAPSGSAGARGVSTRVVAAITVKRSADTSSTLMANLASQGSLREATGRKALAYGRAELSRMTFRSE